MTRTLEIPEAAVLADPEAAIETVQRLKAIGVRTYLDHFFGSGTTSLNHLQSVPIDRLKIDRSLVAKLEAGGVNAEIVATIMKLSHQLGKEVIAEGVETPGQRDRLRELRCEYAQGNLFSEPLEPEAAAAWMARAQGK